MIYDATLQDLINIPVKDNWERLVKISDSRIFCQYHPSNKDMEQYFWWDIIVRHKVAKMLSSAQDALSQHHNAYILHVTYGYRSLETQQKRYNMRLNTLAQSGLTGFDLESVAHETVAHPQVAWHPTWWAVDVLIRDTKLQAHLDFWSPIYDYSNDLYKINNLPDHPQYTQAINNRILLRTIMLKAGFIPYDGEYWHFSYWDQEWAYHTRSHALYAQIPLKALQHIQ